MLQQQPQQHAQLLDIQQLQNEQRMRDAYLQVQLQHLQQQQHQQQLQSLNQQLQLQRVLLQKPSHVTRDPSYSYSPSPSPAMFEDPSHFRSAVTPLPPTRPVRFTPTPSYYTPVGSLTTATTA